MGMSVSIVCIAASDELSRFPADNYTLLGAYCIAQAVGAYFLEYRSFYSLLEIF